jgi:phospholipase C
MSDATNIAAADPIKHVLVLALENRSFDHMLGACQVVKPDIDGIPPLGPQRSNSYGGKAYLAFPQNLLGRVTRTRSRCHPDERGS